MTSRYPGLAARFGLDLRSLALLRVLLSLALLISLCGSLASASLLYSDQGIMPRAWAISTDSLHRLSLFFLDGSSVFAVTLLLLQCAFAIMLLLGWRTRLASIASFVLWASLLNRNPLVITDGDTLMTCLLFWLMFLPANARYSVDAALAPATAPENKLFSWAALGLMLQIVSVYFFSALSVAGLLWHGNHLGLYQLFSLETDRTWLGHGLLRFPLLLKAGSALVWWLALLAPLLAFSPLLTRPLRSIAVVVFSALNLGLILCMDLGNTAWIYLIAWTPFIGHQCWDWLAARQQQRHPGALRIYYDRDCGFCIGMCRLLQQFLILPQAKIAPAQDTPRARALLEANQSWVVIDGEDQAHLKWPAFVALLRYSPVLRWLWPLLRNDAWVDAGNALYDWVARHRHRLNRLFAAGNAAAGREIPAGGQRVAAAALILTLIWNLSSIHALPSAAQRILSPAFRMLRLDQTWNVFAPYPFKDDGWFVIPAQLADHSELDLLHPGKMLADDERAETSLSGTRRWQLYLRHLTDPASSGDRREYARYLCRQWNAEKSIDAPQRLVSFKLVYMLRHTPPPGTPAHVEQIVLSRHDCAETDNRTAFFAD
ncbi:MAG: DCC1-like thiol-disulfide oxidoreductase family protein [Stenotrophobium sp.]